MEIADTICAVSTPPGEGGIGILRISGPLAHNILREIFQPRRKRNIFAPRTLHLGYIVNPESRDKVDEVFAVFFKAPYTYTREDMAEVYSHGGFSTQQSILSLMMKCGARLAEPGEFTKRAFLNGRIDLLQAESVLDIIQGETDDELKCAMEHLEGRLSGRIKLIQEDIKEALVVVEVLIDFPDENIDVDPEGAFSRLRKADKEIERLVESYYLGRAIRHGMEVLIIGRANVGKSSLLNSLLLKERAIVTPLPGTTRDLIEDIIHIKGIKIRLVDTAGLRTPKDVVEEEGIERVKRRIPEADLILWVLDGARAYSEEDEDIHREVACRNTILAINKIDLPQKLERPVLAAKSLKWQEISALDNTGIEDLKNAVHERLVGKRSRRNKILITNLRHREVLHKTHESLQRAIGAYERSEPLEFTAFELRDALSHIGEITGETCPDEILHTIFDRFCIGK
ncbi:MAG: tRNA modification GTPase MnmE [Syntrophorhabdus sp. PtaU1.Bin002]|nr:MAG: tRNA modification GTPase MnmE [Syntrophorhabdus sp. PtaB.Bin006]OPY70551.1 MAG: tRNA modification GTPase MnmE [Syntrophorhabdus sp. PtaU1.Bin002]